jgi:hypothetical protein
MRRHVRKLVTESQVADDSPERVLTAGECVVLHGPDFVQLFREYASDWISVLLGHKFRDE